MSCDMEKIYFDDTKRLSAEDRSCVRGSGLLSGIITFGKFDKNPTSSYQQTNTRKVSSQSS